MNIPRVVLLCFTQVSILENGYRLDGNFDISIERNVYNELFLATDTDCSSSSSSISVAKSSKVNNNYFGIICAKLASCSCSRDCFVGFLFRLVPFLRWLPNYNVKNDLLADITGGVTVGIMHIPQGNINIMCKYRDPSNLRAQRYSENSNQISQRHVKINCTSV